MYSGAQELFLFFFGAGCSRLCLVAKPKRESPIAASAKAKRILKRVATHLDLPQICVLDKAVEALADYFEHHGERLMLPLNYKETFSVVTLDSKSGRLVLRQAPYGTQGSAPEEASNKKSK